MQILQPFPGGSLFRSQYSLLIKYFNYLDPALRIRFQKKLSRIIIRASSSLLDYLHIFIPLEHLSFFYSGKVRLRTLLILFGKGTSRELRWNANFLVLPFDLNYKLFII